MSFWQEFLLKFFEQLGNFAFGVMVGFIIAAYLFLVTDKRTVRKETFKEVAEAQANQTLDSLIEKELKKK